MSRLARLIAVLMLSLVVACATTPYKDLPAEKLSDEQLVEEFAAAAEGVGRQVSKAEYLRATKPDPLYVLSGSTTTYFGTSNVSASAYAAPVRGGYQIVGSAFGSHSGIARTSYYYSDATAMAQAIHTIGAAISSARAELFRKRGSEVVNEMRRRVEQRRVAMERPVDAFFSANQWDAGEKALVTSVLAWIPVASLGDSDGTLSQAKSVIQAMQRGPGVAGDWYGVFAQESTRPDGHRFSINNFVRINVQQDGSKLTGEGELGTGERIEFDARVNGNEVVGTIANPAANISVSVRGTQDEKSVKLDFDGGSQKLRIKGRVALFR